MSRLDRLSRLLIVTAPTPTQCQPWVQAPPAARLKRGDLSSKVGNFPGELTLLLARRVTVAHRESDLHIALIGDIANLDRWPRGCPLPRPYVREAAVRPTGRRSAARRAPTAKTCDAAVEAARAAQADWAAADACRARQSSCASWHSRCASGEKRPRRSSSTRPESRSSSRSAKPTLPSRWASSSQARAAVSTGARRRRRCRTGP